MIAGRFLDYWEELRDQSEGTAELRTWTEAEDPVDLTRAPSDGLTYVFSPRSTQTTLLDWYASIFDGASSSAHITGAFGIHKGSSKGLKKCFSSMPK